MTPRIKGAFDNTGCSDQKRALGGNTGSMRCPSVRGVPQRSHTIRQGVFVALDFLRAPLRDVAFGICVGIAVSLRGPEGTIQATRPDVFDGACETRRIVLGTCKRNREALS